MSWSLAETRTLATRAARGAGLPWGLAEEAGYAVHWLQSHGAPGADALARFLEWRERNGGRLTPAWMAGDPGGTFSPLEFGVALMDANRRGYSGPRQICQPLLFAPFIAANAPKRGCRLIWNDISVRFGTDRFHSTAPREVLLTETASCLLSAADDDLPAPVRRRRVPDGEEAAISRLGRFAARTYAPATEASRIAGAGAGLTDND